MRNKTCFSIDFHYWAGAQHRVTLSSASLAEALWPNCCSCASHFLNKRVMSCVVTSMSISALLVSSKLVRAARPCSCLSSFIFCLTVNISVRICSLKATYWGPEPSRAPSPVPFPEVEAKAASNKRCVPL